MTQMDLLVTNVAELLATAVHEVLRLMGQAVSEYRDESSRIRQENQKLHRTLEELQKRLQISDAVQQVSSSVAAEELLYESHPAQALDFPLERDPAETEDNDESDSYELPFEEKKPSTLHLRDDTREPNDSISTPCNVLQKRRRSFSSLGSQSDSREIPGAPGPGNLNPIKTESEFPQCQSEETENITDTHLHLPYLPVHVNRAHMTRDAFTLQHAHVRTEMAVDAAGSFSVTAQRDNSHICHVCGKSFATASSLGAHFVCHSGERPFVCEHCKFRFSRLADLKKHEVIHTGEKPYNCTLCGRRFNRRENLRRHLRKVHHGALL